MSDIITSENEKIERLEVELLHVPQVNIPLVHKFAPGVYYREVFMPAGTFIIGHEHLTEHFNVVLTGKARVLIEGVVQLIQAPCTFVSKPGVRKVLYILEDMRWATIHPTTETDISILETSLVRQSKSYMSYHERNQLMEVES